MVLIAAAIGLAAKKFGSKRDDDDEDVQGDDPIVRALFKAVNLGQVDDFMGLVNDDCTITMNSYEVTRNDGTLERGPALWKDAISDMRQTYPDIHWELYDELTGKDEGKQKIAVRFVSKVTAGGQVDEWEVSGFGIVEDDKLSEWHQVADLETYNRRRAAMGEDTLSG
jgi:hypothetical protein